MDSFDEALAKLKSYGAEFTAKYNELMNSEALAYKAGLHSEWESVKSKADAVKNTIIYINNAVSSAVNWFSDTFSLNGMQAIQAVGNEHKQQLGLLPLVPIAYVVAATAAVISVIAIMTNLLGKLYEFKRKSDLVESGLAPSSILNDANQGDWSVQLSGVLKFGLILGAAYFIVPKLLKAKRR